MAYIRHMGEFTRPFQIKPFCAVMAPGLSAMESARQVLEDQWGPIDLESDCFDVEDFTDYYRVDMPANLIKRFFSFQILQSVETMNREAKFWTNSLEADHLNDEGQRLVNLDPGYLTLDKLVLYTTKNFSHRLYLREGLFAEITLTYDRHRGQYQPHEYTYPDYATAAALDFFLAMRQRFAAHLKLQERQS